MMMIIHPLTHLTSSYFTNVWSLIFLFCFSILQLSDFVSLKPSHPQWALSGSGSTRLPLQLLILYWADFPRLNWSVCVCVYLPPSILTSVACPTFFVASSVYICVHVCLYGNWLSFWPDCVGNFVHQQTTSLSLWPLSLVRIIFSWDSLQKVSVLRFRVRYETPIFCWYRQKCLPPWINITVQH